MSDPLKPIRYENDLGDFGPIVWDSLSREPVAWGFEILNQLGEERFEALKAHGTLHCVFGVWSLLTRQLTRKEAEEQYGPITNESFGPRGGWRSATFGSTTFTTKFLRPEPCPECQAKPPKTCGEYCNEKAYPDDFIYSRE